jgi:dTDP-4-dehydrorhamnose reductase
MKVLITGANGMLGSSLCRLISDEHEVHAFHRDEECFALFTAEYSLELADSHQFRLRFNQVSPDLVIHCASLTNVDECETQPTRAYKANVTTTENIAQLCSNQAKLVYISTDQVYGETENHSETNEALEPVNQYGNTKLQGEQKVQQLCVDHIIVRTNIIGWNVKPGRVSSAEWIYYSLRNGEQITLFSDYNFSPIYVDCLGSIIMQLVDMDFKGIVNAGSPTPCSKYDFGLRLADEFGVDQLLIRKGSITKHQFSAQRLPKLGLDCGRLSALKVDIPEWWESLAMFAQVEKT